MVLLGEPASVFKLIWGYCACAGTGLEELPVPAGFLLACRASILGALL